MSTTQQTTTETIKALLDIVKTLKNFIDLQSTRIDSLEKNLDLQFKMIDLSNIKIDRLEKLAIVNNKIQKRYQMTEGQEAQTDIDKIKEIPAGRKDQDLIDKKWREVSELGI